MDIFTQYKAALVAAENARLEVERLRLLIVDHVNQNGSVQFSGVRAYYKPGRRTIDHEAAAKSVGVAQEIIDRFTKTKSITAWAEVTKAANVDTSAFVSQSEPTVVIDVD
jgi:hypothetical protein